MKLQKAIRPGVRSGGRSASAYTSLGNMVKSARGRMIRVSRILLAYALAQMPQRLRPGAERVVDWCHYRYVRDRGESGLSLIDKPELRREVRKAVAYLVDMVGREAIGDYLEFGVFYGASMVCVNEVLHEYGLQHVRLFGFDSFQGLPLSAFQDDAGVWSPGAFKSNYRRAVEFMTQGGIDWQRTFLAKGWFSETATPEYRKRHDIHNASLIMIDCDMYLSTKDALNFCAPLIKDQTIVFFDDWNAHHLAAHNLGEQRAFAEFLQENPNLGTEEFGAYSFRKRLHGKVFRVFVKDTAHRGLLPSA